MHIGAYSQKVEQYVERLTSASGFDVVFDTVGGKNLTASMEATRLNGHARGKVVINIF